jgi:hypothetical protein
MHYKVAVLARFMNGMATQTTSAKRAWLTWVPAFTSALLLLALVSLAVHIRIGLGHWPVPLRDDFTSRAYEAHQRATAWVGVTTIFAAGPIWALLLCFRALRISPKTHWLQAGIYLAGWGLIALYVFWDPLRFWEWLAD